jgi:hypothetical protein
MNFPLNRELRRRRGVRKIVPPDPPEFVGAARERVEANERPAVGREIAKLDGNMDRLVDAISDGIGDQ